MRPTLLELTQMILSSLESDNVNSISDNDESMQVANILKQTFFNIVSRSDLPEHRQLIQLQPSLDETMPVLMFIPQGVTKIDWVKYFNSDVFDIASGGSSQHGTNVDLVPNNSVVSPAPPGYQYVTMIPVAQFLDITNSFNPEESNVQSFTFSDQINGYPGTYTFYYKNDRQPMYCTCVTDNYIVFDSFDSAVDSTLQASKTMAYGSIVPIWVMEDDYIPPIDESQIPLLLNEAKSLAFYELKQTLHQKAEQEAKRGWSAIQKDKSKFDKPSYFDQLPNFGRWGRSSYGGMSYFKLRGWDRP